MKKHIAITITVCTVLMATSVSAGTVTEYIRIYGHDAKDENRYYKGESDELIYWKCGTTSTGGDQRCYKFVGAPDHIWQVRVHMYRDDGGQYKSTNWWYWQQEETFFEDGDFYHGGYFDTGCDLEGYWGYRNGHYTYRGEHSGGGCASCVRGGDYYWYFPKIKCSMCFYSYPLMAVNYIYPNYPNKVFDRYFFVGEFHRDLNP